MKLPKPPFNWGHIIVTVIVTVTITVLGVQIIEPIVNGPQDWVIFGVNENTNKVVVRGPYRDHNATVLWMFDHVDDKNQGWQYVNYHMEKPTFSGVSEG